MTPNSINIRFAQGKEIEISKREAFRYMGYKMKDIPQEIEELYSFCLGLFRGAVRYKACYTETDVSFFGDGELDLGFGKFKSYNLEKNLSGCKKCYIFAATCGMDIDRLIMRYTKTEPSKSLVLDAIGSAAVEDWCNKINFEFGIPGTLKPRFSPGYGDLPLSLQPQILSFLDAYRKIGLSLSGSCLMIPTKSVTAIVGIKENNNEY